MIQSPKLMLAFVWDPHGFQIIEVMPKGKIFTAACYLISEIFSPRLLFGVEREVKGSWWCMQTMQG
jgi:hypothetical protein